MIYFENTSNADYAKMSNAGKIIFQDNSSAGQSVITTANGGQLYFSNYAKGYQVNISTQAGGLTDISGLSDGGLEVGAISGAGTYYLGSDRLIDGTLGTSTTVSGQIEDGGRSGRTGGSLEK